ncbi:MAG: lipoyl(octanoyl) transferase LipB [Flavobacteriaceae bacterium]|jgi:lipoyl(octanoyl) transferase|tara:strand:- start:2 stop:697 length:696 start_codon:yes stop_codon:yes gene_type:complete
MNNSIIIHDLGLIEYEDALDYQLKLFNEIVDAKISNRRKNTNIITKNHLIFVEHNSVYTLGKSGEINNLLMNKEDLKNNNIKFYKTNRGGDITYHGPGQIVCYPILDLDNFFTDIHKYLRFLEETIILTLKDYGIDGKRSENETGVWLNPNSIDARKICAMGVKASRWVTMHGLALNVNNDLSYFENIIPCGIRGKSITSIAQECEKNIQIESVKKKILKNFLNVFSAKLN